MKFLNLLSLLLLCGITQAQQTEWVVKAGENAKEVLGDSVIYQYPQFTGGTVYFKDGSASNGNLNLNLFNGEMQFINAAGDTMALSDAGLAKYITIQNDTFYFSKVYVQSVYENKTAKLAKLVAIKQVDLKKKGAYSQSSSISSINSASYFLGSNNQVTKLTEAKEVVLHKETFYFIGDKFNNFKPAFKKNIFNMFNSNKSAIDAFIKSNKINLDKIDDLVKLVYFIQQTQP